MRFAPAFLLLGLAGLAMRGADETAVALPPFIVEEASKGPPWRYGEAMGYEILSRCNDKTTRQIVESHYQLHELLADILPRSLQVQMTVPRALILYDEELQPAASKEVISRMLNDARPGIPTEEYSPMGGMRGLRPPNPTPSRRFTFLPNLRLWDRDAMMVFMISRDGFDGDRLSLTQDYVTFLVRSRLPALPLWFTSGFLSLHRQIKYEGNRLSAEPLEWISHAYTTALKKDPKTAPPVAPLADFFAARQRPDATTPIRVSPLDAWQSQAELFVRWGLDERAKERRAAFWKFVEQSATQGVSEALFQECFGMDFAAGLEQLTAYLPTAVQRTMRFKPERMEKLPPFTLVNASEGQIARLKGDWERLEIAYVKTLSPGLDQKYLEQARKTLQRAYDHDERDPRLLAVMGLCEADAGNASKAREYLESAVQIGPVRPRAYYELARLRFEEAGANPGAEGGRLSVTQMADVFALLFKAREQQPPLPEVYELIADVWLRAGAAPSRRHLAVLDEGVQLFPRRPELALKAAELNLRFGFREDAALLIGIAARVPGDEHVREKIAALQQQLETK
jgi:tetratricopeptide (TPR) repeat protein